MATDEGLSSISYLFDCVYVLRRIFSLPDIKTQTLHSIRTARSSYLFAFAFILAVAGSNPGHSPMAASMATSTVSNAVRLPSKDAAYSSPAASRNSSLRIPYKPAVGILGGRGSAVGTRRLQVVAMANPPPAKGKISDLVDESIKKATEICADGDKSGECAAAWDEVEEVSAAASDLRNKEKVADPLENFCKDNPESDECRTYDN